MPQEIFPEASKVIPARTYPARMNPLSRAFGTGGPLGLPAVITSLSELQNKRKGLAIAQLFHSISPHSSETLGSVR
jgi:hypothetical protein